MGRSYHRLAFTIAVAAAMLVPLLPQPSQADTGHSHLTVRGTMGAVTVNPNLNLTLAVNKASAIPSDTLAYSGTVTHTGITICVAGSFTAQNTGSATATVADFFDEIDYLDPNTLQWTPLAGLVNTKTAFVPVVTPRVSTGITLTVTSATATGVVYPTTGDPIIGTTIASGATAAWSGQACLTLTAAQLQTLSHASGLRETRHMEDTPGDKGEAWSEEGSCPNPLQYGSFLNARNIVVTVTPPSGPAVKITSSTVPAFASLAPGASANYSTGYLVPIVATRATGETEAAYLQRLANLEGSSLVASASVTGTGPTGAVSATAPPVSTIEHLPVVTIAKNGPTTVTAGTTATYSLALTNTGGATASSMAVTDTVPSGASGSVSGIPASLAGNSASAAAQATFPVLLTQSAGDLTDTATLTWHDANGNSYGSVSSSFTTQVQAPYKLTLPATAGPNPTGAPQAITATLVDLGNGQPVANKVVTLTITGPNAQVMTATSDINGIAVFAYLGVRAGIDLLQATASTAQSNTLSIVWYTPIQKVTTTAVQGNFYAEPGNPQSLAVTPQSVPDFSQTFPNIAFNPPSGTIPHSPVGAPTDQTRPFTDVTTDLNGNYNGTIVAQGNGLQAGLGTMTNFNAVFTANLVVAQAGDVTFNFYVDDGFLFGVANGASRVSGAYENPPATNQSAIQGYSLMGAFNQPGQGNRQVTVHFPAAGTYPYELDYFDANGAGLSLSMSVSSFTAQTNPLSVYVGYADGLRAAGSIFPFPWLGSPGVNFIGGAPAFDAGAVRFDNSSSNAIILDSVTVDIGGNHFDLWGRNLTVPAGQILMLSQTSQYNFDTSDFSGAGCGGNNGVIPKVNVTIAGVTTSYNDSNQILNTFGFDLACRGNESLSWQRVGGGGNTINVPLPPATSLSLSPAKTAVKTVGQTQIFTVSAMDATGHPVANLPVAVAITGANQVSPTAARQLTGTTDSAGIATVSYVGTNPGTDTASASAFVMGLRSLSNTATVSWVLGATAIGGSAPAPAITAPAPPDGATVTKPVPISATFAPPAGETIASWNVTYQDLDPLAPVTIASGTGTPPATLGTFDPTLLPNDTYAITISATASGGGIQTLTSNVIVAGNLKLGRYVSTYQDLSVSVNGFQMQVRRTYDSVDKHYGDFGIGWHVDLANFRTSTNRELGAGGWTQYNTTCGIGLCLTAFKTSAPHFVTVVFPDGHVEMFDFQPTGGTNVFLGGGAAFTARPGTTSTLQADGDTSLTYTFDGNLYGASGPYDPQRFKLTTRDGHVLFLDKTKGLLSATDRLGNALTIDAGGVHASSGASITFSRDAANSNRITAVTGPNGETVAYTYAGSDLATSTDPIGNATSYSYDGNHHLLSASGPAGPLQTLQYDAANRLVAITDATGNTTRVTNSVAGQQQVLADPNGQLTTIYTYDDVGDTVTRQQVQGSTTATSAFAYDNVGRLTSMTDPLGRTQRMSYDAAGNMVEADDEAGNPMHFTYNALGQPLTQSDPLGAVVSQMTYDGLGQLIKEQHGGSTRTYTYDAAGHLLTSTNASGGVERFSYDTAGHLANYTDAAGVAVGLQADVEGRITTISASNGAVAKFTYDAAGDVIGVIDPSGHKQSFTYDMFGHIKTMTDMNALVTTLGYDAAGRLLSRQNRDGSTITYQRDAGGRVTRKTLSDGTVSTYTYDALGRMVNAANTDAVLTYGYDVANQVTSVTGAGTATSPQPTVALAYGYDLTGNVTSLSGPDGTTKFSYDADHHLTTVTDPVNGIFRMTYDSFGHELSLTRPNGVTDTFTYDATGQLTARDANLGATAIAKADYTYGPTGSRATMTDLNGTTTFGHDVLGQLTSAVHPAGSGVASEAYAYDPAGNRTSSSGPNGAASYDAADHLTQDALFSYVYDLNGNLTSRTNRATGAVTSFSWNAENQLKAIHYPDGTVTQYRYDAAGRRIEVNANGSISRFAYDRANQHLQYDGANQQTMAHVTSQNTDDILETTQSGLRMFYVRDAQGSTTALTDSNGAVTGRTAFDSYGTSTNPGLAPGSSYGGREFDSKSGLYFLRQRTYDPGTGRFLGEDPMAAANPYPYAANDPVDYTDPTGGTFIETAIQNSIAGAIVGAVSNLIVQLIFSSLLCGHPVIHWGDAILSGIWGGIAGFAFTPWAEAASVWTRAAGGGGVGAITGLAAAVSQSRAHYGDFNHLNGDDLLRGTAAGFAFGVTGGIYSGPGAIGIAGSNPMKALSDNATQAGVSGLPGAAATTGIPYNCNSKDLFS